MRLAPEPCAGAGRAAKAVVAVSERHRASGDAAEIFGLVEDAGDEDALDEDALDPVGLVILWGSRERVRSTVRMTLTWLWLDLCAVAPEAGPGVRASRTGSPGAIPRKHRPFRIAPTGPARQARRRSPDMTHDNRETEIPSMGSRPDRRAWPGTA
jgi:hypothetical protein